MIIKRFKPPYRKNGKTAFPESQKKKGVYIIKIDGKIAYIGMSGYNLYKTLYRHFQSWNDKTQKRISYVDLLNSKSKILVRIIYTNTVSQAANLERALILKYKPTDNPDKLELFDELATQRQKTEVKKQEEIYNKLPVINDEEAPF